MGALLFRGLMASQISGSLSGDLFLQFLRCQRGLGNGCFDRPLADADLLARSNRLGLALVDLAATALGNLAVTAKFSCRLVSGHDQVGPLLLGKMAAVDVLADDVGDGIEI